MVDEDNCCIFAVGNEGRVGQFSFDFQGKFGRVIKQYTNLGLGEVFSSFALGDLILLGGDYGRFGFIHKKSKQVLKKKFQVAPEYINSIQLCLVQGNQNQKPSQIKALLAVSGSEHDYASFQTDVFDFTPLISKQKLTQSITSGKHSAKF